MLYHVSVAACWASVETFYAVLFEFYYAVCRDIETFNTIYMF